MDKKKELIGENIREIRISEYILPEIQGTKFAIRQGTCVRIEVRTDSHKLLSQNKDGGL